MGESMDVEDDDQVELQQALALSLQEVHNLPTEQGAGTSPSWSGEEARTCFKRRGHDQDEGSTKRALKTQASPSGNNIAQPRPARQEATDPRAAVDSKLLEQQMLQRALALSLEQFEGASEPSELQQDGLNEPVPAHHEESREALTENFQAVLNQHASENISSDNPFAGLFSGQPSSASQSAQPSQAQARDPAVQVASMRKAVPEWAASTERWAGSLPSMEEASTADILVPESQEVSIAAAISKVLGMPVVIPAARNSSAKQAGSITVRLVSSPGSHSMRMSDKAIEMALKNRLLSQHAKGAQQIQILADCYARSSAAIEGGQAGQPASTILARWRVLIARQALSLLQKEDKDDLYFTDGGQQTKHLLQGLGAGTISQQFLEAVLAASHSPEGAATWEKMIRSAISALKNAKFTDSQEMSASLQALDLLFQQPALQHALAAMMIKEVKGTIKSTSAAAFEQQSVLAPLLAASPIPDIVSALKPGIEIKSSAAEVFTDHRTYGRPGEERLPQQSIRHRLWQLYSAAHSICARMAKQKLILPKHSGREALLAWLAAAINTNAIRASKGEGRACIDILILQQGGSDKFAVGLTALCLRFSQWLHKESITKHVQLLSPSYYSKNAFRWHHYEDQTALMGQEMEPVKAPAASSFAPDRDPSSAPHFAAECFFLTQLAMHNCLLPAVNRFNEALQVMVKQLRIGKEEQQNTRPPREFQLFQDCTTAQLLDPSFAGEVVKFCFLEAAWLTSLLRGNEADVRRDFAHIPDFVVKDMASWLTFVIRHHCAELLGGLDTNKLIEAITGMLLRPDLVRSAVVQSHLVELLQTMLAPQMEPRRQFRGSVLGPTIMRPGEAQLVAAVYNTGATQTLLVPALMKAFTAADHVIGLDVDRDRFDKFVFRDSISSLLTELWKDQACLASLTSLAKEAASTPEAEMFSDFVGALMNSLIYLLEDCLLRLQDIHNIEAARKEEAAWRSAGPVQMRQKEQFYQSQQHTTQGFMRLTWRSVGMLKTMAKDAVIRTAFWEQPLVKRFAYAAIKFVNKLAGPECQRLEVEEPEKYLFYPSKLLSDMAELIARLSESPVFVEEMAEDPDYDEVIMQKAREILSKDQKIDFEIVARLERVMQKVKGLHQESRMESRPPDADLDLSFSEPEPKDLETVYHTALQPYQIGTFDSRLSRAYNREFAKLAEQTAGNTRQQMRRLAKEMRDLPKLDLTLEINGGIIVQHDIDRLDKVRMMIVGPVDTPYQGGCFMFDLFFPADYPNVPPLMLLETTGLGRARFHPNLYADGKVCLSLLGTFHGSDASQKWNPAESSLYQIVMSVLGLIFVADPCFAEPNVELVRGTNEGDAVDRSYNASVVLNTVRYAMIDQLKSPRPGFEEIIKTHFKLQRHRIMAFCKEWLQDSRGMDEQQAASFEKAVKELHGMLTAL